MRFSCFVLLLCFFSLGPNLFAAIGAPDQQRIPSYAAVEHSARSPQSLQTNLLAFQKSPTDPQLWLELGQDYMSLASSQHWDYLDKAADLFGKYLARFPKDPLANMLMGRVLGARALDGRPSTFTRLKWARNGFKQMDEAVKLEPNSVYLRLLRAEAALMAHPILTRGSILEEDTRQVLAFFKSAGFAAENNFLKARVHLFLGNYAAKKKQKDDSLQHWQEASQLAQASTLGLEASARLNGTFHNLGFED